MIIFPILIHLAIIGTFMEGNAFIIILAPWLVPIVNGLGMDLVHFGIIMVVVTFL